MKQEKQQENKPNKRLPLNSDIVFKRVFSKEENKELLKSLLQAILNIKIKSVEVKNPEIPRDLADSKAGIKEERQKRAEYKNGMKKRSGETVERNGKKQEKIEIAKKLLEKGEKIEEIVNITGLTKEEVEKLK